MTRVGVWIALCLLGAPLVHAQQFAPVPPPAPGRSSAPVKPLSHTALLAELKRGGNTVYIRHTATDFTRDDVKSRSGDDCDNQRPLTDKGRDEARRMGADMKRAGFPISEVLASPRCRTVEAAKLAFGNYKLAEAVRGGAVVKTRPRRGPQSCDCESWQSVLRHCRRALSGRGRSGYR